MTETQPFGALELSLDGEEQRWPAEIEAQGTDHLRVRLVALNGETPHLSNGQALHCTMEDSSGRYSAGARVLSQNGPTLWLNVEPQWRKGGRRAHPRSAAGFGVSFEVGEVTGIGVCLNVSAGGMRVRIGRELPLDMPVRLMFRLPHYQKPVLATARILYQREIGETRSALEVGLKFVEIPIAEAAKIATFCTG